MVLRTNSYFGRQPRPRRRLLQGAMRSCRGPLARRPHRCRRRARPIRKREASRAPRRN